MFFKSQSFSIILLSSALALIGLLFVPYLTLNLNPSYQYPSLTINTLYAYATPDQVEREITRPIESILSTLPNVTKIYSRSTNGRSSVTLSLHKRVDVDLYKFQVLSLLRQIHSGLPAQAGFPSISLNKPGEEKSFTQILTYSIYAPLSREAIYQYATNVLSPQIAGIKGLYKIEITGGSQTEYVIEYDADLMQAHGVSFDYLSAEIRKVIEGVQIGDLDEDNHTLSVKIKPDEVTDLANIVLKVKDEILEASKFIKVYKNEEKPLSLFRINGKNNIRLSFIPESDVNQLELGSQIKKLIHGIPLPDNYELLKEYDTTEFIQSELDKIKERTFYSILILMIFVFLVYRNIKHILTVIYGLIVTTGVSFILYYLLGVQLNLYSLAAITISFGIVIDNLILMVHHYGHQRNVKVLPAIISATITTLAALVVFWFLPEDIQWNLTDFGRVLMINLLVSILAAWILIPSLMEQLEYPFKSQVSISTDLDNHGFISTSYKKYIQFAATHRKKIMVGMTLLFGLPLFMLPNQYKDWDLYNKTIGSDWYLEYARPYINKYLGGTLRLFSDYVYTRSSFRSVEETKLYAGAYLPLGSTMKQTDELMRKLELYLDQYNTEIKNYNTHITDHQTGQIEITFKKETSPSFPYILERNLISFCVGMGEVEWSIYGVGKGYSNASYQDLTPFTAELRGYNIEKLDQFTNEFANLLESHPRIETVKRNVNLTWGEKSNQQLIMDLDQLRMSELELNQIMLRSFLLRNSQYPSVIAYSKDYKPIRMVDKDLGNKDIWHLENTYQKEEERTFAIKDFSNIKKQLTPPSLHKENQQHIRRCGWVYVGNERYGQEYLDECIGKMAKVLPMGYTLQDVKNAYWGGTKKNEKYWYVFLVPLIIFVICSIHFESFLRGLQIIMIIPLSFIGIFITFYYFDFPFDQGGYVSFLITSGLSVNAVIFIFSEYGNLKSEYHHLTSNELFFQALKNKLAPIVLTILSTVLGMLPFVMHGEEEVFWFALAVGTIGGLLFSLLIIVWVLPAFVVQLPTVSKK